MGMIRKVAALLQSTLGPELDAIGRRSGVIRRQRKFSGASLLQTVVLTMMKSPNATTADLVTTAAQLGVMVTPTAVEKRFSHELIAHLKMGLEQVLKHVLAATPAAIPVLEKFTAVEIADSTTVTLPEEYAAEFPGCGGKTGSGKSAVKIQVAWEMRSGCLRKLVPEAGRQSDAKSVALEESVAPGSLWIRDLGYFCLKRFRSIAQQQAYWISRWQPGTTVVDSEGKTRNLLELLREQPLGKPVDLSIFLGATERLGCRLIALRVPPEMANRRRQAAKEKAQKHGRVPTQDLLDWCAWTVLVTNCQGDLLTWKEVVVLYRTRWQIELLFKLWKSHGGLAAYRSQWSSVERMAMFWAKLIGVILQHWLLVTATWADPRRSFWKAARVIRDWIVTLTIALADADHLIRTLEALVVTIGTIAKTKRQRKRPSSFELLMNPELLDWTS